MRQSLGGSLRHHRAVLGLTQNALARRAGVSQAYLSQVEAGRRVRVSASILLQLADALGVTVTDLMGKAALAIPRATRSEAWLYQMSQRPAWGPLDYARDVREGRLLAGHWNEAPPSGIQRLHGPLPTPGDLIILVWAPTDADRPGIAGFGVITEFDAQQRLRFRALPPNPDAPVHATLVSGGPASRRGHPHGGRGKDVADH
jgi:transcriptional regulator with XRE-family HTH domain